MTVEGSTQNGWPERERDVMSDQRRDGRNSGEVGCVLDESQEPHKIERKDADATKVRGTMDETWRNEGERGGAGRKAMGRNRRGRTVGVDGYGAGQEGGTGEAREVTRRRKPVDRQTQKVGMSQKRRTASRPKGRRAGASGAEMEARRERGGRRDQWNEAAVCWKDRRDTKVTHSEFVMGICRRKEDRRSTRGEKGRRARGHKPRDRVGCRTCGGEEWRGVGCPGRRSERSIDRDDDAAWSSARSGNIVQEKNLGSRERACQREEMRKGKGAVQNDRRERAPSRTAVRHAECNPATAAHYERSQTVPVGKADLRDDTLGLAQRMRQVKKGFKRRAWRKKKKASVAVPLRQMPVSSFALPRNAHLGLTVPSNLAASRYGCVAAGGDSWENDGLAMSNEFRQRKTRQGR
ncbi:hypothetical protein C8R45DRAFT_1081484 [Mycena sanguinolenta]|nr:hypothetical protein C8R45DRAFT_1081484 [Mycena sanguinolenta]